MLLALALAIHSSAQSTGQTIRHHKIAVEDSSFPPELTEAENAIEKKDYAGAEPLLEKVVAADAGNFQAWFDLGFIYSALGRPEEAIAAYHKSVAAKPDVFESNLNLGLTLAKKGEPDAEQYLRAATGLKPTANVEEGHLRAWLSLARVLENSKPDQALEAYRQAAALAPSDPEPHLESGALLERANHLAEAEREYKLALAIDPGSSDALTGLANVSMRDRRFPEAAEALSKLVALRPDDVAARLQLGRVLEAEGKNDDALAQLEATAKLAPADATLQRDLASLYTKTQKYAQAEALYRSLLAAHPNDPELHHGLGVALLNQKKYGDAQQEFLSAVKLKPDFGPAYGDLAVAASENKNYELAIKAADARARFMPEIPVSYFLRASAYDHLHEYKLAAENYHKFLDVAKGEYPDQEWQARHRLIAIEPKK